jgi:RsiW-degrading membrane proteinase PrsW (M82 family)
MLLVISAALPVVIFLIIIYRKDTQREPPGLLLKCFFLGCVATIPVVFVELFVSRFNVFESAAMRSFYDAFIVAALVEEGFKFLFLYWIVWKRREFDQHYDGIVYAVFVSLGFALVENVLYVLELGLGVALMRALLSIPGHGLFGVCMGYFFALARFSQNKSHRTGLLWLSFLVPFLFHGLYDFFLMYLGANENALLMLLLFAGFIALMIILWRVGIRYIRKHHAKDSEYIFRQYQ